MKSYEEQKAIAQRIVDILAKEHCCVSEAEYILAGVVLHIRGSSLVQDHRAIGGLPRGTEPFKELPFGIDIFTDQCFGHSGGGSVDG